MNTGKQYSFWQLISSENENTAILIPRIQRDYIQYRTGKVKTNLERFVNKLITTIVVGNCSINLNFIYGNATKKHLSNNLSIDSFNPIDGQQRLTTLFLLHFYIFNEAGSPLKKDLKNSFFYDTRSTTQLFLDTLIDKEIKFYGESSNPSKIIKNSGWYSALWDFDPSVLSCLKVLDQIHTTFKDLHKTSDKELYIDCRPSSRCVKYNNSNMISYKSGDYISLISGSNVISVEYDGTCSVLLRWKEAWV